jgi:hypothetical protein
MTYEADGLIAYEARGLIASRPVGFFSESMFIAIPVSCD